MPQRQQRKPAQRRPGTPRPKRAEGLEALARNASLGPGYARRRPGTDLGSQGYGLAGFAGWSNRRKLRLARTVGIALAFILILWQCTGGDGGEEVDTAKTPATTIPAPTTTIPPAAATMATPVLTESKLPAVHSLAGGAALGGRIVLAGGLNDKKNSTDIVWTFDPATGSTDSPGKLAQPLHTAAVAPLGATALMMGGGKGDSVFDTVISVDSAGAMAPVGKLPQPRTNAAAVGTPDGTSVYLFGGYTGKDPTNEVIRTSDGVNFEAVANLLRPTRFPAVALLGRSVWVIGGEYDKQLVPAVQRVDLDTGLVSDVALLPTGLSRASAFVLGNSIFVAGGRTPEGRSNQILRIDPITGAVTPAGTLPTELSDSTAVVVGDTAYLFGGLNPTPTNQVLAVTAT